jgi:hypothetical protein
MWVRVRYDASRQQEKPSKKDLIISRKEKSYKPSQRGYEYRYDETGTMTHGPRPGREKEKKNVGRLS